MKYDHLSIQGIENSTLIFETAQTDITAVFENADVKFTTNMFPADHIEEFRYEFSQNAQEEEEVSGLEKRDLTFSIGDFFKKVWGGIKSIGDAVSGVVSAVKIGFKILIDQPYDYRNQWTYSIASWNYNKATGQANKQISLTTGLICENCFATLDFSINFVLAIKSRSLETLILTATGSAKLNIDVLLKASGSFKKGSSMRIGDIQFKPIVFVIAGIPMLLNITVPIDAGYNVAASASGTFHNYVGAQGSLGFGFQYTKSGGKRWISEHTFNHNGALKVLDGKVQATLEVYLLPTVVLTVDYIGGPYLGVQPYVEATLAYNDNMKTCASKLSYNLNWGMMIVIGAQIDITIAKIQIYSWKSKPYTIYSMKRPISSGCVNLPLDGNVGITVSNADVHAGTVWEGYINPTKNSNCAFSGSFSLQYLGQNSSDRYVASYHIIKKSGAHCDVQALYYSPNMNSTNFHQFTPILGSEGADVTFAMCDDDTNISPTSFSGKFTGTQFSKFVLKNSGSCPDDTFSRYA